VAKGDLRSLNNREDGEGREAMPVFSISEIECVKCFGGAGQTPVPECSHKL
jgi:hypothetical protein